MITLEDYLKGHDVLYPDEWTPVLEDAGLETVKRANLLLSAFGEERGVTSGWRPKQVNRDTAGAAPFSRHITAQAIDLADPEGDLDDWCFAHPDVLERIGLWQEHPASTKGWCHMQTMPPKSGRRVFYP